MYQGIDAILKPLVGKKATIYPYGNTPGYMTMSGILNSVEVVDDGTDLVLTVKDGTTRREVTFKLSERLHNDLLKDSTFNGRTLGQILPTEREEHASLRRFSDILCKTDGDFDLVTEDGKSLSAHKIVLAARSPIFAAMFNTEMKEKKSGRAVIKGYSFEALQVFVDLLYGKRHAELGNNLGSLIELFDAYQVGELLDEVGRTNFMLLISVENAADLLFLGAKHRKLEIVGLVLQFIKANESLITETEKWKEWMDKGVTLDAAWMTAILKVVK